MRTPRRPLLLLAVAVSLSACGSAGSGAARPASSGASGPSPASGGLAGSSWVLASYVAVGGAAVDAARKPAAGLQFAADGTLAGSTGCNRFTGTYVESDVDLTITVGPVTLAACPTPALTAQERALLAGLAATSAYQATGGDLVLLGPGGGTLLTYAPGLTTLAGTSWQATGINNGAGGVVSTADTGKVTAAFSSDGTLSGSGGCNSYSAAYTTTAAGGLSLGPVAATQMACVSALMALETQYFAALEQVTSYRLDGDRLALLDASGATQVAFSQSGRG